MPVAVELFVQVRVGIDVENRQWAVHGADRPDDGMRDGVVAAERQRPDAIDQQGSDAGLDQCPRFVRRREVEISRVGQDAGSTDVTEIFGPRIAS